MKLLENKVCLVTGSNRGIGASIVKSFAEEGAVVYANARAEGCIDEVCEKLSKDNNTQVIPIYFDVTDESAAKTAIMQIKKEQGRLDVLVNNAGIMKDSLIGMIGKELMKEVFDVNVFAAMSMLQLASKLMKRQKSGSIINFSSIVGVNGSAGSLVYSASKGAVATLTKSAAKELAGDGIRVNAVAPGMIETDLFKSIGPEKIEENRDKIFMKRFGTPEEVADVVVFLASDQSRYITGQIIGVDGMTIM